MPVVALASLSTLPRMWFSDRFSPSSYLRNAGGSLFRASCTSSSRTRVAGHNHPANPTDSLQAHPSTPPVVGKASGKLSDFPRPQPTVTKTPGETPREVRKEPDSIQPQWGSGPESTNKGLEFTLPFQNLFQFRFPLQNLPRWRSGSPNGRFLLRRGLSPTSESSPFWVQLCFGPPPGDCSPWVGVITNDNLSSQPCIPPNPRRSLSPKQSRTSFAGTVFESVSGSQQYLPARFLTGQARRH